MFCTVYLDGGGIWDPILDPEATPEAIVGENFEGSKILEYFKSKRSKIGNVFAKKMRPKRMRTAVQKQQPQTFVSEYSSNGLDGTRLRKDEAGVRLGEKTTDTGHVKKHCKLQ